MTELERDVGLVLLEELARQGLISEELRAGACRIWQSRGPEGGGAG